MLNRTLTAALAVALTAVVAYQSGSRNLSEHASEQDDGTSPRNTGQSLQEQLDAQSQLLARIASRLTQIEQSREPGADTHSRRSSARARAALALENNLEAPPGQHQAPASGDILVETLQRQDAEMKEQSQRRIAGIDSAWKSEIIDPGWAESYTADLRNGLESRFGASMSVSALDCRTTICKIDLSADPSLDVGELNGQLAQLAPLQNTEFSTLHPEGSDPGHITIYLARPGGQGLAQLSER